MVPFGRSAAPLCQNLEILWRTAPLEANGPGRREIHRGKCLKNSPLNLKCGLELRGVLSNRLPRPVQKSVCRGPAGSGLTKKYAKPKMAWRTPLKNGMLKKQVRQLLIFARFLPAAGAFTSFF